MHPVLKEEERILDTLQSLKAKGHIDEALYYKIKPRGSQPARLYGLAKVHKDNTPVPKMIKPTHEYSFINTTQQTYIRYMEVFRARRMEQKNCSW